MRPRAGEKAKISSLSDRENASESGRNKEGGGV